MEDLEGGIFSDEFMIEKSKYLRSIWVFRTLEENQDKDGVFSNHFP